MNPLLTANLRADRELKLALIREKLVAAQPHLIEALNLIHHSNLAPFFGEIYSHVADAHFYCGEAIYQIDQHPHPDDVYDVALVQLPPTTGKLHPPEPAF